MPEAPAVVDQDPHKSGDATCETGLYTLPGVVIHNWLTQIWGMEQIWGQVEQQRRLRLLISLGSADVAAEAFAKIQMQTIRKAMRFLEVRHCSADRKSRGWG